MYPSATVSLPCFIHWMEKKVPCSYNRFAMRGVVAFPGPCSARRHS